MHNTCFCSIFIIEKILNDYMVFTMKNDFFERNLPTLDTFFSWWNNQKCSKLSVK